MSSIASRQKAALPASGSKRRKRLAVRVTTLLKPLSMRLTRVASWPTTRVSRACTSSAAAAVNTASEGTAAPSHSRSIASVSGIASATSGSWTLRTSITTSGAMNVTPTNAISGRVSAMARMRALRCAAA